MVISGLFFAVLNRVGSRIITERFADGNYLEELCAGYLEDLQDYIDEEQVASSDSGKLTEWVKKQKIVSIQVYKDEILTYDSNYPDAAVEDAAVEGDYYEWEYYYTVTFTDGTADVFLYGFFSYPFYSYAVIAEILLSVTLLILIVILGIRKRVKYIGRLKAECEILGSGDLGYQITVQGRDEITLLARGLDNMRTALRESNEKEAELTAANRKMITEMSHDLRTPLTSLLIYTEILGKKAVKDPEKIAEYVEKIEKKARQIKQLSDNIFEYALITEESEAELGEPQTLRELFYDPLSEMTAYLEEQGFTVNIKPEKTRRQVRANEDYINRIIDNIVSNIVKYADISVPVEIDAACTDGYGGLTFRNGTARGTGDKRKAGNSTNIGLHNIEKMMKSMNGSCRTKETEKTFEITVMFPWTN